MRMPRNGTVRSSRLLVGALVVALVAGCGGGRPDPARARARPSLRGRDDAGRRPFRRRPRSPPGEPAIATPVDGPTVIDVAHEVVVSEIVPPAGTTLTTDGATLLVPPGAVAADTRSRSPALDAPFRQNPYAPDEPGAVSAVRSARPSTSAPPASRSRRPYSSRSPTTRRWSRLATSRSRSPTGPARAGRSSAARRRDRGTYRDHRSGRVRGRDHDHDRHRDRGRSPRQCRDQVVLRLGGRPERPDQREHGGRLDHARRPGGRDRGQLGDHRRRPAQGQGPARGVPPQSSRTSRPRSRSPAATARAGHPATPRKRDRTGRSPPRTWAAAASRATAPTSPTPWSRSSAISATRRGPCSATSWTRSRPTSGARSRSTASRT